jgi:hypothetical protein
MKKLILTLFILFTGMGVLIAGDCGHNSSVTDVSKKSPELVLSSNDLQLLKYADDKGTTRFTIQNLDGTVVAEDMSRLELRIDFPEIEKKFES